MAEFTVVVEVRVLVRDAIDADAAKSVALDLVSSPSVGDYFRKVVDIRAGECTSDPK